MRFPTPTPFRAAVALAASVAVAGCSSFFTGIPDVDRVEVSVAPRVVNVNQSGTAVGIAYNGNRVVTSDKRRITYRSENTAVATVNPTTGLITGVAPGVAYIVADTRGVSGRDSVIVRLVPARSVLFGQRNPRFRVGATNTLIATPFDSVNGVLRDRAVQYRSLNEGVLTIASNGVVTPRAVGTAQVIATVDNGLGGGASVADTVTATVTVPPVATVQVSPSQAVLVVGQTQQYTATVTDSLNNVVTGRTITWVSGAPTLVSISSTGLATALAPTSGPIGISALVDRIPGESGQVPSNVAALSVTPPASATTTSNQASVNLKLTAPGPATVVLAVGARDANGATIVGRAIRASGFDPNVVQVTFSNDFSQAFVQARTAGTTTVTFQARDAANQADQGTPVNVTVTVAP